MPSNSLPPSVATAALLKSQLDQGRDYFELLTPFVLRAVPELASDVIEPVALRNQIAQALGLDIPLRTIAVLLNRLSKRQGTGISKETGAFLRTSGQPSQTPPSPVEEEFAYLGDTFAEYCQDKLASVRDRATALTTLCGFLETHASTLVLDQPVPTPSTGRREDIVIASFLQEHLAADSRATDACTSLVQGLVLARAVTLDDLAAIERRPSDLVVYFDTPFILAIAGLYGEADLEAAREAVRLVRDSGAAPAVFDVTIAEVRRVLAVYESKLDTADGRQSLYRTPLTSFFLARNATGLDARTHSALLQGTVGREGLTVHETPQRVRDFVADEPALVDALRDVRGEGFEARETHDLNCVAAVLTLRRGRPVTSIANARAVFAATGMIVRTTRGWWQKTGGEGLPPVLEQSAVINYFWLRLPRVRSSVHRLELAALCSSILQPSPEAWALFRRELAKMTQDGRLSSTEASLVLIDSYASKLVVDSEEAETLDPGSVAEIIERVKREHLRHADEARAEAARERAQREKEVAEAHELRQQELVAAERTYVERLTALSAELESERKRSTSLETGLVGVVRFLAWLCAMPMVGVAVAAVAAVTLFPVIGGTSLPKAAQVALQALTVLVGFGGGIFGWSALSLGKPLQASIERRLIARLLPGGVGPSKLRDTSLRDPGTKAQPRVP